MDSRHALRNRGEVQSIFLSHPYNVNIFTGHYHVEKAIRKKNILVHITPSCFFQIDMNSEAFRIDHYRIAFRLIEMEGSGLLRQSLHYFDGSSLPKE